MGEYSAQIREAFKVHKEALMRELQTACITFCEVLCEEAIAGRRTSGGHNITGNLINSIVVGLYRERKPVHAVFASDTVKKPIHVKMTKGRTYHFDIDYDNMESTIKPDIKTNEGYGYEDALEFFLHHKPKGRNLFDIVVAYPVEYAEYIEEDHQSTGILQTYAFAEHVGVSYLQLPRA